MGPVLEVAGLTKRWPNWTVPILHGLDLQLAPGTAIAIEGANGAGKTTLLRVITGLLCPDAGSIMVCGRTIAQRVPYQRELGLAAAGNSGLYARLNARHHLSLAARIGFVPRPRQLALINRSIEHFGLADFALRRVDRLSMGQRQRLRLALAFLHEPRLVLLDEPFTSLDPDGRRTLISAISDQRAAGRSVLLCGPPGDAASVEAERLILTGGALSPQ